MTPSGQTIRLAMIVRNEAAVIARCLSTVRGLIDMWTIVDTGSSDGTQDIIRSELAGLPGLLIERPWVDFATNRNQSIHGGQLHSDYVLVMDADDMLQVRGAIPELTADGYYLGSDLQGIQYGRLLLIRDMMPWRWRGVVHEFLECSVPHTVEHLPQLRVLCGTDGSRRTTPGTALLDAARIQGALQTETDEGMLRRYTFYLAQSLRDGGDIALALATYQQRAKMGGWEEEVFVSLMQAASLSRQLGQPLQETIDLYERAVTAVPGRLAEAAVEAAQACRVAGQFRRATHFATQAVNARPTIDGLFVDPSAWEWRALDELSISAFYADEPMIGARAAMELLERPTLPAEHRERVIANLRFNVEGMAAKLIELNDKRLAAKRETDEVRQEMKELHLELDEQRKFREALASQSVSAPAPETRRKAKLLTETKPLPIKRAPALGRIVGPAKPPPMIEMTSRRARRAAKSRGNDELTLD